MTDVCLGDVTAQLGGELIGPAERRINRIGPLEGATPSTLSFLSNPKYQSQLAETQAGCVIVAPAFREAAAARGAAIVTDDPYLYFARLTQWWARRERPAPPAGIHPSAVVAPTARIGREVRIEAFVVVEDDAVIEDHAVIGSHCVIGQGARVGHSTRLAPRVSLLHGCSIGARGIVHSGVVIGADGFGFAPHQGQWVKIEQLGKVRIGDDVEIGANSCIDRGALDDTVIEDGVKLDNLVQIAHNVHIGAHTAMAGCVGVAGSARIGAHCTVGGGAGILGHLTLADHVHVSSMSLVTRSILQPGLYSGVFPIDDNKSWEKNAATLRQLHTLRERIRALEKKLMP
ncbi:UDP-3-O-(3-hydroxymyristoyl)glucosamine N-acyltransferase [Caldimonas brevitalea]|uniref:UDP-3-O-acylglucosamine N-acyltransferase n=1 Tax=Caldimonas brevitalea TaxID=413882 RepID=A0A0G3BR29_9BURK|nr:UDP-3-O-(3-hydroxymyristoyl)glucosamine N-acyltransferase [Caldimonas brevitalea]AKJ29010.1 UDP-3-O-(3-hydroxymyristoyl) glucosamine N-acyltransferase [Caldimonas brevitalea]